MKYDLFICVTCVRHNINARRKRRFLCMLGSRQPGLWPDIAAMLQRCCSDVAAMLQRCCSDVAAMLQRCCSDVADARLPPWDRHGQSDMSALSSSKRDSCQTCKYVVTRVTHVNDS